MKLKTGLTGLLFFFFDVRLGRCKGHGEGLTQCGKEEGRLFSVSGVAVPIFVEWAGLETLFLNIY